MWVESEIQNRGKAADNGSSFQQRPRLPASHSTRSSKHVFFSIPDTNEHPVFSIGVGCSVFAALDYFPIPNGLFPTDIWIAPLRLETKLEPWMGARGMLCFGVHFAGPVSRSRCGLLTPSTVPKGFVTSLATSSSVFAGVGSRPVWKNRPCHKLY